MPKLTKAASPKTKRPAKSQETGKLGGFCRLNHNEKQHEDKDRTYPALF
jgi:hypothetical protein